MELITAATVLPGPAGERIPDGAVLVDGATVHAVGPRAEIAPLVEDAQHAQQIQRADFPEHTVLPGLLNAHVHLAFDTTADWYANLRDSEDPDLLLGMAGRAQRALAGGVTTLRDLGDRNHLAIRLRDAIDAGDLAGPRVLSAGSPITVPDGHCWFLGGEAADERAIRARVAEHADAGSDLVKVMASGGSVTPNSPPMWQSQFGLAELRVLVDAARSTGLPVAAHAHGTQSIMDAVAAGVDTIEHATWIGDGGSGSDLREDTARAIADQGIAVCPGWPADWRSFADRIGPERTRAALDRMRWMAERGVTLIAGTDAGLNGSEFRGFPNALGFYREIGYGNAEVIELATTTTAGALGLGKDTGQIAPGYAADLLVVEGDPLSDLANLARQTRVLRNGRAIDRPA